MFISLCQEEVKSLTTVDCTWYYFNRSAAMGWVFGTYTSVSFLLRGGTTSLSLFDSIAACLCDRVYAIRLSGQFSEGTTLDN